MLVYICGSFFGSEGNSQMEQTATSPNTEAPRVAERRMISIEEFCEAVGISRPGFFLLKGQGCAPRFLRLGDGKTAADPDPGRGGRGVDRAPHGQGRRVDHPGRAASSRRASRGRDGDDAKVYQAASATGTSPASSSARSTSSGSTSRRSTRTGRGSITHPTGS